MFLMHRCCWLTLFGWIVLRAALVHAYRRWYRVDTMGRNGKQVAYW